MTAPERIHVPADDAASFDLPLKSLSGEPRSVEYVRADIQAVFDASKMKRIAVLEERIEELDEQWQETLALATERKLQMDELRRERDEARAALATIAITDMHVPAAEWPQHYYQRQLYAAKDIAIAATEEKGDE